MHFLLSSQNIPEIQILMSCTSRLSSAQIWTTISCVQNKLLIGGGKTFLSEADQLEVDIMQ